MLSDNSVSFISNVEEEGIRKALLRRPTRFLPLLDISWAYSRVAMAYWYRSVPFATLVYPIETRTGRKAQENETVIANPWNRRVTV